MGENNYCQVGNGGESEGRKRYTPAIFPAWNESGSRYVRGFIKLRKLNRVLGPYGV
jgi:hypothetical protein